MRHTPLLVAVAVIVAACTGGTVATTTSSTTTTTEPPPPPTSTTIVEPLRFTALGVDSVGLAGLPDGPTLTAGFGRRLGIAFDDLAGGIVFEQEIEGVWQTFHLPAGRRDPVELVVAGARLGDVGFVADRPVTAASWTDDALLLQTVKGGAPEVFVREDLDLPAGSVTGVSLGGDRMVVAVESDGCHDAVVLDLTGEVLAGPFGVCSAVAPVVTPGGGLVVWLEVGASTRVVFVDVDTGEEVARHQTVAEVVALDTARAAAVVTATDRVLRIDEGGTVTDLAWEPAGSPVAATALRAPLVVSDLASLGGTEYPTDCSASELPPPREVSGLSPEAARTRTVIAGAARNCDFYGLARAASGAFSGPDDLADAFIRAEIDGIPLMADLVRTLDLPFTTESGVDGASFVWPSVASVDAEVGDADWEALEALYNEERIEEWRSGRGPFDGMSVRITEDGAWVALGGVE